MQGVSLIGHHVGALKQYDKYAINHPLQITQEGRTPLYMAALGYEGPLKLSYVCRNRERGNACIKTLLSMRADPLAQSMVRCPRQQPAAPRAVGAQYRQRLWRGSPFSFFASMHTALRLPQNGSTPLEVARDDDIRRLLLEAAEDAAGSQPRGYLSGGLQALRAGGRATDAVLECGGETFTLHSQVLAAQGDFWFGLFCGPVARRAPHPSSQGAQLLRIPHVTSPE